MTDAGQVFEPIRAGHELARALGGNPPDGIVGVAPEMEHRNADHAVPEHAVTYMPLR